MSDFDHATALRLGGWDPRYAVVLAAASRDGVAAAVVDTNGDGADIDLDQYMRGADGGWVEIGSGSCDETGALGAGRMALAWGRTIPNGVVTVEHEATRHSVRADDRGWWMFVHPSTSWTAPAVRLGD